MTEKQPVPYEQLRRDEVGGNHAYRQRPEKTQVQPEQVKKDAHEALLRERQAIREGQPTPSPQKRPDDLRLVKYEDSNGFKS